MPEARDFEFTVEVDGRPAQRAFISTEAIDKLWGPEARPLPTEEKLAAIRFFLDERVLMMVDDGQLENDGSAFVKAADIED